MIKELYKFKAMPHNCGVALIYAQINPAGNFPTGNLCLSYKLRHVYIVERIDRFAVISDLKVKVRTR